MIAGRALSRTILLFWLGIARGQQVDADYWRDYETGVKGAFPQVTYRSTKVGSPLVHVSKWNSSCDSESHVLLSPHGQRTADNKVMLLDSRGNLVWYQQESGAVHNPQVQRYKGNDYITYWVGDDEFWGHGAGYYKMLDQTYTLTHTISAVNGSDGDYHEFSITPQNTALLTAYVKTPWDLSKIHGRENGYIWDCIFQEVDVETNELLFQWRASEHFKFADMAVDSWSDWTGTAQDPWDWLHLNSVQKDDKGNYLIASRYTNAITYIDGVTGRTIWQIGGLQNSFIDLSEGNGTRFVDPHMARWDDDYTTITLFDNIDFWTLDSKHQRSRGVKLRLDMHRKVVRAAVIFEHPDGILARSEGALQRLSNGNYFISYGSTPLYAEFSPQGDHMCDTHYAPMQTNSGEPGGSDAVETYRIFKGAWTGMPKATPRIKVTPDTLVLHWNGATEVRSWKVEGRGAFGSSVSKYTNLGRHNHEAFETEIPLAGAADYTSFRLTALDSNGASIRGWLVQEDGSVQELGYDLGRQGGLSSVWLVIGIVIALVVVYIRRDGSRDPVHSRTKSV